MLGALGFPPGNAAAPSRAKIFKAYKDFLCPVTVPKSEFLSGGTSAGGKADYQGCSEFTPLMIFSATENQRFSASGDKTQRNAENQINRRVLGLFFRSGANIDTSHWPCPTTTEGHSACRFYARLVKFSPCEIPAASSRYATADTLDAALPNNERFFELPQTWQMPQGDWRLAPRRLQTRRRPRRHGLRRNPRRCHPQPQLALPPLRILRPLLRQRPSRLPPPGAPFSPPGPDDFEIPLSDIAAPANNYLFEYPDWTRLAVHGGNLCDLFDQRTPELSPPYPLGARAAVRWVPAPDNFPLPDRALSTPTTPRTDVRSCSNAWP